MPRLPEVKERPGEEIGTQAIRAGVSAMIKLAIILALLGLRLPPSLEWQVGIEARAGIQATEKRLRADGLDRFFEKGERRA